MSKKYFGTDGIRGRVGSDVITPELMLKLGWAIGKVLPNACGQTVLIGKDTRVSGYMLEYALTSGLTAAGVNVELTGPLPTPAISYLTNSAAKYAGGIVISASHNPYFDNGIKIFDAAGNKLSDSLELAIEDLLASDTWQIDAKELGKVSRQLEAPEKYVQHCLQFMPEKLAPLHVVLDCANGATYQVAPEIFRALGLKVTTIAAEPNGWNINADCGSTKPKNLQDMVLATNADLGIAFDGDGDRVAMVDHQAELIDGDSILFMIARMRQDQGLPNKGIVGTLMSNLGLEQALKQQGIEFKRVKVGDKYVREALLETGWHLGGESSGHIICTDYATTGDGILSALQVLQAMAHFNCSLAELDQGMDKLPQVMVNVPLTHGQKFNIANPAIVQAIANTEASLGEAGRVLLRPSGTEPLVRVMVEGPDLQQVQSLAEALAMQVSELL